MKSSANLTLVSHVIRKNFKMSMIEFEATPRENLSIETCEKSGLVITIYNQFTYHHDDTTYVFDKQHVTDAKKLAQFILDWVNNQLETCNDDVI